MLLHLGKLLSLEGEILLVDVQHLLKCWGPAKHLTSCSIPPEITENQRLQPAVGPIWQNTVTSPTRVTPGSLGTEGRELL